MSNGKSPAEIERANRMFALELTFKLGLIDGKIPLDAAKDVHSWLQENTQIEDTPAPPATTLGFSVQASPTV